MKFKIILSFLPIAFFLSGCTERPNIEFSRSDALNENFCRINHITTTNVENLLAGPQRGSLFDEIFSASKGRMGIIKYDSGKTWAWINYFKKDAGRNQIKENPKIMVKLFINNIQKEEIVYRNTYNQSILISYFEYHASLKGKPKLFKDYEPALPAEDIWPIIKSENMFRYIGQDSVFIFEISENDINKWAQADKIKILIETDERPMIGEINQEDILPIKNFREKCFSKQQKDPL